MKRFSWMLLVAVGIALIGTGCAKKAVSDDTLSNGIKGELYSDPTTKAANISVAVKGGIATLSGDVPSSDVELQAMKLANATPGVARVDDQMKVTAAMAAAPPAPDAAAQSQAPPMPAASQSPAITPQKPPVTPAPTPVPSAMPPASSPVSTPAPVAAPVRERVPVTVPVGQSVSVQMIDSIDSARNTAGQVFRATLYAPIVSHGRTIFPAGTPVTVLLSDAKGAGRIRGSSQLELRLSQINYHGRTYPVTSSAYEEVGKGRGKSTAVRTGVGAAAGAIIGALAGGGKGAAIGSAVGGGGTAGYQLATHGQQVKVPSEAVVNFRLEAPLTVEKRVE
jgi:BON domain